MPCLSCKTGKVNPKNHHIGVCTKCSATQRLDKCGITMSASLLIDCEGHTQTLQASLSMIQSIAADGNITNESDESLVIDGLLMAKPFSMTFKNNYINAVYREQQ